MWLTLSSLITFIMSSICLGTVFWGMLGYQAYNQVYPRPDLPLKWFDQILTRFGSLLPLFILLWRYVLRLNFKLRAGHGMLGAFVLISGVAIVRLLMYLLHIWGQQNMFFINMFGDEHLMSDHVLLGTSVTASFMLEFWNEVVDYFQVDFQISSKLRSWIQTQILFLLMLNGLLFLLTCGDLFYTARYFHYPWHTFVSMWFGVLIFKLPVVVYILIDGNRLQFC
eukprot:TRINITY_DN36084_c0_g2_i2.p1 TRINITY_DN36084_c0_g2~~TRINITY_DN36084_c0_g2_i2.p1  ORF type:complete len:263 (+),score=6.36 TRINITY_DN36084_c0_g2_i2:118-789(+)